MVKGKFVASFSGGKDSTFAIYKAMKMGLEPMSLVTTFNSSEERSWFHGMTRQLIEALSEALQLPINLVETDGSDYQERFELLLREQKETGGKYCVFGDIDIEEHFDWDRKRCKNAGLNPLFPLFGISRKEIVEEFIDCDFKAIINVVDTNRMDKKFLGKTLSRKIIEEIEASGADICGENGEYHTIVYDGPIFKKTIELEVGEIVSRENISVLPIEPKRN